MEGDTGERDSMTEAVIRESRSVWLTTGGEMNGMDVGIPGVESSASN